MWERGIFLWKMPDCLYFPPDDMLGVAYVSKEAQGKSSIGLLVTMYLFTLFERVLAQEWGFYNCVWVREGNICVKAEQKELRTQRVLSHSARFRFSTGYLFISTLSVWSYYILKFKAKIQSKRTPLSSEYLQLLLSSLIHTGESEGNIWSENRAHVVISENHYTQQLHIFQNNLKKKKSVKAGKNIFSSVHQIETFSICHEFHRLFFFFQRTPLPQQ